MVQYLDCLLNLQGRYLITGSVPQILELHFVIIYGFERYDKKGKIVLHG